MGRIIARTLTLCAAVQAAFGVYLLTSAVLNAKEALRVAREARP